MGLLGVFLGALVLPELEKKLFKRPVVYQIIVGLFLGLGIAYVFEATPEWYATSILLGGFFGSLTRYWWKGISLPC